MKRLIVILLIALGFVFRIWVVGAFPQPFIFDQWEYHAAATIILSNSNHLYAPSYRMSGYPLVLAVIYSIFGMENANAWIAFQILLDVTTAFIVFLIARLIFSKKKISYFVLFLYVLNPYTSGYVGVRLTEIVTVFILTCIIYLFLSYRKTKSPIIFLPIGLLCGILPQMRPGYIYLSLVMLFWVMWDFLKSKWEINTKSWAVFIYICLFVSSFVYEVKANIVTHGQASVMTTDNLFVREFYISLFIEKPDTNTLQPPEVRNIYTEYSLGNDLEVRNARADKYLKLAIEKVKSDPQEFLLSRIRKLWYVWEKYWIFPYANPSGNMYKILVYWMNNILLMSSLTGFLYWMKTEIHKDKTGLKKTCWYLMIFLVLYTSVLHAFTITSGRFSIPLYPEIILFAGYFYFQIFAKIQLLMRK